MLKQLVNDATFTIRLHSETPLLVKAGIPYKEKTQMEPVLTRREGEDTPFLPGSSAKGVLRSHAERIARTLAGSHPERGCCDLFDQRPGALQSCSARLTKLAKDGKLTGTDAYRETCPVCKFFGCLSLQSRCQFSDFYAQEAAHRPSVERRDGVGIDRYTGGASRGALFDMSVAVGGKYTGTIRLRNFEVWHLGLLAFVLRDLKEGRLTFGTASSRGLGQMRGELVDASVRVFAPDAAPGKIVGLGTLTGTAWSAYGFASSPAEREGIAAGVPATDDGIGIGQTYQYKGDDQVLSLLLAAAPVWGEYIRARATGGN